jgi:hypothetical protein
LAKLRFVYIRRRRSHSFFFHGLDPSERVHPLWVDVKEKVGQYSPAKDFIPGRLSSGVTAKHLRALRQAHIDSERKIRGAIE